ncbi:MAG: deoxyguanosinetriphosphate triphosphohydrolase, partial [Armatimonadota bacterium]
MSIRERTEALERRILSPHATFAADSRGRARTEDPDPVRTCFQQDRDRVLHSKAFRRLKHKTQVFLDPEEDHYRTRLTHTLEVAQISRTVARALRLNEDLAEAIALAHDLGHPPFGHEGEYALDEVLKEYVPGMGFRHYEQSRRVVDLLEKGGQGLNLTHEVRAGIVGHSKGKADLFAAPSTTDRSADDLPLEAMCVRICDRIAYLNHDIDDAVRAGVLDLGDLPGEVGEILGTTHGERIGRMVSNVIENSTDQPWVAMSEPVLGVTNRLKDYLFENVYLNDNAAKAEFRKGQMLVKQLFRHYMEHPDLLPGARATDQTPVPERAQVVLDYVAGMTDRFAGEMFIRHFFPREWRGAAFAD